jgi:hypothetical protein
MDKIKIRITELFQPTLKRIEEQTECNHNWLDKHGSAYFRCSICGYLAEDRTLDKLIMEQKLLNKGLSPEQVKKYKDFY